MHRITSLAVAAALLVAACGGATADQPTDTSIGSTADSGSVTSEPGGDPATIDPAETQRRVDEIMALPADERDAQIAALSRDYEQQVAELSGLHDALGGPDAAAAELGAAWGGVVDQIRDTAAQPIQLGLRSSTARVDGPNIGEGLFATVLTVGLLGDAAVKASNTAEPGSPPKTEGTPETKFSGSLTEAAVDVDVTFNGDKVTTKLKVHVKVLPCPDPNGHFTAEATAEMSATAGSVGQSATLTVSIDGDVDDNAELVGFTHDYRMQWADFAGGKGKFADISGGTGKEPTVNRTGGAVTPLFAQETNATGQVFGLLIAVMLERAAETGWKSGRCVKIDTTAAPGPTKMQPGSTSAVTAAPRSKVDGMPAGGTVTATLASGGKGIDPAGTKVRADASFTYSAPDEKDKSGTVAFDARSKRGIGKAEVTFDTKGGSYTASYEGGGISISGTIADLSEPFETTGKITGGQVAFRYVPTDAESGSVSHNDPCGPGCVAAGSGTYTIAETEAGDGTLTMTMALNTCVTVTAEFSQEICEDRVHPVLLTPA